MDNPKLGREVVDVMDVHPGKFSMHDWVLTDKGELNECGTVACLGGWTLLKAGYSHRIVRWEDGDWDHQFTRPDGSVVDCIELEVKKLLGMSHEEVYGPLGCSPIWFDWFHGPDRFRKIVEESEGKVL